MAVRPVTPVHRPTVVVALCCVLSGCGASAPDPPAAVTEATAADPSAATAAPAGPAVTTATTSPPTEPAPEPAPEPTPRATEAPVATGLEEVDLGEADWLFRPGASVPETVPVPLRGGTATVDTVTYTLGEVLHVDLNDDGLLDAAAQLTATDGNGLDDQWYLWVATDGDPYQVSLPIARTARCGTVTESVSAVPGGIEVHELRRGPGEDGLDCASTGGDERTRTVAVVEARNTGEWWPAQVAPAGGFGGLCPTAVELDGFPHDGPLYAAPDAATPPVTGGGSVGVFALEGWPVYGEAFPGWVLVGVVDTVGGNLRCAWSEVTG